MTRAINVDASEANVTATCAKHGAVITSIETLKSGGTRVVLTSGDGAALIRRAYGSKVIDGAVTRAPLRLAGAPAIMPSESRPPRRPGML